MTPRLTPPVLRTGLLALVGAVALSACVADEASAIRGPAADATSGGALVVAIPAPLTVDPAEAFDDGAVLVAGTICDTLIAQDPVTGELVPSLAESWRISSDGYRLVVKIRDGVRMHDGRQLRAEDVAYSLSRLASPDTASRNADLLEGVAGYDVLRGNAEAREDLDRTRLSGVRVTTGRSVEISFDASSPRADFAAVLTHPATAPVSQVAAEMDPEAFRQQPVCAGPYAMTAPFSPGDRTIEVARFDDHFGGNVAATNGGRGYVDTISFRVQTTQAPHAVAGLARSTDVARLAQPQWDAARTSTGAGLVHAVGPAVDYVTIPAQLGADPTADRAELAERQAVLRRALSLAIDRQQLAAALEGTRVPATDVLPPGLGASITGARAGCAWTPPTAQPELARTLLAESGIRLGDQPLELVYNDDFRNAELVDEIARQWQTVLGLTVETKPVDFPTFLGLLDDTSITFGAFRTSWSSPYPSVDAYTFPLYHGSQFGQGNLQRFSDPDLDELLLEEARGASDEGDRDLAYASAVDLICDALPLIPTGVQQFGYLVRDRVSSAIGEVAGGHLGLPLLRELYVSGR